MPSIRILIANDHHLITESLTFLLDTVDKFEILDVVYNGWQALSFLENHVVDIVLTDIYMPLLNRLEMAIKLKEKFSSTSIIMLTMSEESHHIREVSQAGVYGYGMKNANEAFIPPEANKLAVVLKFGTTGISPELSY